METYAEVLKRLLAEETRLKVLDEELNKLLQSYQIAQRMPFTNKWVH